MEKKYSRVIIAASGWFREARRDPAEPQKAQDDEGEWGNSFAEQDPPMSFSWFVWH
jgi:hypothetical protein